MRYRNWVILRPISSTSQIAVGVLLLTLGVLLNSQLIHLYGLVLATIVYYSCLKDVKRLERQNTELGETNEALRRLRDEEHQANEELRVLATRDPLTGCLNRRSFFQRFESQWNSASRYKRPLSCIMLDLDSFKSINDTHGHAAGDEVLKQIAKTLLESTRTSDEICRFGGDEFCLLLPQTDLHGAAEVTERIRRRIAALEFPGFTISTSLGVSAICQGAADQHALVEQADKCLYAAKRSGGNRAVRWDRIPAEVMVEVSTVSDVQLSVPSDKPHGLDGEPRGRFSPSRASTLRSTGRAPLRVDRPSAF